MLATVTQAHGEEENVLDTLQLHGFLSQALVITDDNDFFGPSSSDEGSLKFTEIGANVSLRPHEDVLIAAQVLSRRAGGDGSDANPELDYGLIDYQIQSNQQRNFGVQVGRFKNPFGFYNQTRDVAFTRPSILLPQSIYFDRTRSLGLAGDGISLYHEERLQSGTVRSQVGFGRTRIEEDVDRTLGLDRFPGSLDADTSAIGQVRYEHDGGRIITALSAASANADYDSPGSIPGDGEFHFQPWILSFQYNQAKWSLTAEYALRTLELEGFNSFPDTETTGESWYVQYTRRFLDNWQWLVRYDSLVNDRDDRDGEAFEASGAGPAYSQFAKDVTFGLQWTPHPRLMLSGEYHHVDGTGWLPVQDNPAPDETSRYWNMLLFQLSLRF
ncbi:hypothetical protein EKG36_16825 [Halomonas nitroreducens]|uniref:Porin n=1 Tax=Halomonas nitroreducens TaxID=447425 RepID=A0A431V067_9GAMM|nr:hypothetical protein EKG36_16825 [Halomonas nitroreducens]